MNSGYSLSALESISRSHTRAIVWPVSVIAYTVRSG